MKSVLVTGAGRGIGLAAARLFLQAGLEVTALDKDFSACDLPAQVRRLKFDLVNLREIPELLKNEEVDVLVNNAGTLYCHPHNTFPENDAAEILTVNLRAPVALIEAVSPAMRKKKSGRRSTLLHN